MANIQLGSVLTAAANVPAARAAPPATVKPATPAPESRAEPAPPAPPAAAALLPLPEGQSATQPVANQAGNAEAGDKALQAAIGRIQEFLNASTASLEFTVDEASGRTVIKVIDSDTKALIRQIPSDEVLAIARALDRVKGLLLQQQA